MFLSSYFYDQVEISLHTQKKLIISEVTASYSCVGQIFLVYDVYMYKKYFAHKHYVAILKALTGVKISTFLEKNGGMRL